MSNTTEIAPVIVTLPASKKLSREAKARLDRLRANRAAAATLKAQNDEDSAWLIEFSEGAKALTWGASKLAGVISATNVSYDAATLKSAFPEAEAAARREKPYKQIR